MKRSWIGFGLLILLLCAGLLTTWAMAKIHTPASAALEEAACQAMRRDWTAAEQSFFRARQQWEQWTQLRSWFSSHSPTEEVEGTFALAEVYLTAQEEVAFAAACRELSRMVDALGDAHGLTWQNIL